MIARIVGGTDPNTGGLLARIDAGWLYLVAGSAVLLAAVLIPAQEDTAWAEGRVARARLQADHQARRLERYGDHLDALERGDPALLASLAAANLRVIPAGTRLALPDEPTGDAGASLFAEIEPAPPAPPPDHAPARSVLARLARGERSRLALIAASALCLLYGLLPPARRRG
ncbi:MAG: hypothetical protein D6693_06790 [Planctomycetota bacterium]|nr:MAG: hypothetical protein D6693_06790 [Planctomycetota bacterium]